MIQRLQLMQIRVPIFIKNDHINEKRFLLFFMENLGTFLGTKK